MKQLTRLEKIWDWMLITNMICVIFTLGIWFAVGPILLYVSYTAFEFQDYGISASLLIVGALLTILGIQTARAD